MALEGIIGRKRGMVQVFTENGDVIPATVIEAGPCQIVQKKSRDKEGYDALQLGFADKRKNVNLPLKGHFKVAGIEPKTFLKEFRVKGVEDYQVGQEIKVDLFSDKDKVDVTGISKGRGFAGVIKRWGFKGGKASHGSMFHRAPGSIGASAYPAKVIKGKKLPGRLGGVRVTIRNLDVVRIDPERNLLLVKGAVPGAPGGFLLINKA